MDGYIRIFDELQKGEDDNPTIGIILCSEKNEATAKYSVLNDGKQLFASKYQLANNIPYNSFGIETEKYNRKDGLFVDGCGKKDYNEIISIVCGVLGL